MNSLVLVGDLEDLELAANVKFEETKINLPIIVDSKNK